jgi:hypothetical protein
VTGAGPTLSTFDGSIDIKAWIVRSGVEVEKRAGDKAPRRHLIEAIAATRSGGVPKPAAESRPASRWAAAPFWRMVERAPHHLGAARL